MLTIKLGGFYRTQDNDLIRISGVRLVTSGENTTNTPPVIKVFTGNLIDAETGLSYGFPIHYLETGAVYSNGSVIHRKLIEEYAVGEPEETPISSEINSLVFYVVIPQSAYRQAKPGRRTLYTLRRDAEKRRTPGDIIMEVRRVPGVTPVVPEIPDYVVRAYNLHKGLI